jgi:hypothetical protein
MLKSISSFEFNGLRDRVQSAADLAACAESAGFRRIGRRWLCGFHDDSTPSASIHRGRIRCFACNESWDAIGLVMRSRSVGFREAVLILADELGIAPPTLDAASIAALKEKEAVAEGEALRLIAWRDRKLGMVWEARNECYRTYHAALAYLRKAYRRLTAIPETERVSASITGPDAPLIQFAELTCLRCEERMPMLDEALTFMERASFDELLEFFREESANPQ